jgi:hypothetical protein
MDAQALGPTCGAERVYSRQPDDSGRHPWPLAYDGEIAEPATAAGLPVLSPGASS